ncbi:Rieske 2Fe-2S domain-containing protein [Betaproteobacteria bacterium PRO4]|uniref:FAD-dependent oxidoreductase n=1 Tax=Nitrosomonas sp. TaxID=42353 RepID=UPI00256CD779|nr:FAD-dependent oxidoreductase [Nitrosomonas sp.]MDL1867329.1 Rieske 2Fe-2S domain-containing protein [Betaproteobacteria bacterium PRO4]
MASYLSANTGPDLTKGVSLQDFGDQPLLRGHVKDEPVILVRVGDEIMAVGASCTHYGAPLEEGLVAGETIRCPWHHACFSLRDGEALGAPAFDSLPCWQVECDGGRIIVRNKITPEPLSSPPAVTPDPPANIVIIGGGAAGFSCAEMLRRRGYQGQTTQLSDDADAPCDRPNLSKDYLAGNAPEEWIPLKPGSFYTKNHIDLHLRTKVTSIDTVARTVLTSDGQVFPFDRLLLATGAEPVRPPIPGAGQNHVFTLRTLADSRAIIQQAKHAKSAVVLGSGFIGLEAAAALRARGLDVHVISLDQEPLEKILGTKLGVFIRNLHQQHGVQFHMGTSITRIDASKVVLNNGNELAAGLVILGVGVRPRVSLAEAAGITVDNGILVNEYLETSVPGIFAAGDAARWHDPGSGQKQRIEHWVLAERHGQVAAENMLGARTAFCDVPFFWSAHYDISIRYVGHARSWDKLEIEGDLDMHDCLIRYQKEGRTIAVAAIGRDKQALEYRALMAQQPC